MSCKPSDTFISKIVINLLVEIKYTYHARIQIKRRKLEKVWIEETIKSPDVTKKEGNKFYVVKKLNGIVINVVYVKAKHIKVITVFEIRK